MGKLSKHVKYGTCRRRGRGRGRGRLGCSHQGGHALILCCDTRLRRARIDFSSSTPPPWNLLAISTHYSPRRLVSETDQRWSKPGLIENTAGVTCSGSPKWRVSTRFNVWRKLLIWRISFYSIPKNRSQSMKLFSLQLAPNPPQTTPVRFRARQGAGRDAFEAVYESEDPVGNHGVRLSKEIVKVAGRAMEKNFTSLGPYVLPISEQYKVVKALALRKVRLGCLGSVWFGLGLLVWLGSVCWVRGGDVVLQHRRFVGSVSTGFAFVPRPPSPPRALEVSSAIVYSARCVSQAGPVEMSFLTARSRLQRKYRHFLCVCVCLCVCLCVCTSVCTGG